jgi:heat shock protein HslJ
LLRKKNQADLDHPLRHHEQSIIASELICTFQEMISVMHSPTFQKVNIEVAILVLMLLLTACSAPKKVSTKPSEGSIGNSNNAPNSNTWQTLTSKTWGAAQLMGQELDVENPNVEAPSIRFLSNGNLIGNTGCNSFVGNFTLKDDGVKLDPGALTKKACEGDQEPRFLEALRRTSDILVSAQSITLLDEKRAILMRLKPKL